MKSLLGCVFAVGVAYAACAEQVAYEGQPIGKIALDCSGKSNVVVSVAFKELSATDQNVSVSNILSTVNLVNGDTVSVYTSSGYQTWELTGGAWAPATIVTQSGNGSSDAASSVRPAVGQGFWLCRRNGSAFTTVYLFGAYVTPGTTTAAHGTISLMGNPKMAQATPTVANAVKGDQIQVIGGHTYTYNGESWSYKIAPVAPSVFPTIVTGDPTIPAGTGFWYVSKGATDVTFTW